MLEGGKHYGKGRGRTRDGDSGTFFAMNEGGRRRVQKDKGGRGSSCKALCTKIRTSTVAVDKMGNNCRVHFCFCFPFFCKRHKFLRKTWVHILTLSVTSCATLVKLFHLPMP